MILTPNGIKLLELRAKARRLVYDSLVGLEVACTSDNFLRANRQIYRPTTF